VDNGTGRHDPVETRGGVAGVGVGPRPAVTARGARLLGWHHRALVSACRCNSPAGGCESCGGAWRAKGLLWTRCWACWRGVLMVHGSVVRIRMGCVHRD